MPAKRKHRATGIPSWGETHIRARLTDAIVEEIIAAPREVTHSELARRYNVARITIRRARAGHAWKHVYWRLQNERLAA